MIVTSHTCKIFRLPAFIDAATYKLLFHPSCLAVPVSLKTNGVKVCQSQQEVRPITIEDIVLEKNICYSNCQSGSGTFSEIKYVKI